MHVQEYSYEPVDLLLDQEHIKVHFSRVAAVSADWLDVDDGNRRLYT